MSAPAVPRGATRPRTLALAAALHAFAGVFGTLAGLLIAAGALVFGATYAGILGEAGPGAAAAFGVLGVAVGAGQVVTARGLLRLRPWAWRAGIALGTAAVALALLRVGAEDPLAPLLTAAINATATGLLLRPGPRRALARG